MINIFPIKHIPLINKGDNLSEIILDACEKTGITLQNNDILIIAQTIISKSEGRVRNLEDIRPSKFALNLSKKTGKDPKHVEIILQESKSLIRIGHGKIITESRLGFVCADAGVDHSNSPIGTITLLPLNPDEFAKKIRDDLKKVKNVDLAVIITDTHGRAFREGAINVTIGLSGLEPILNYVGKKDLYGNTLKTTRVAIADELASAAELLMGEANEKIPAVIIRGYKFEIKDKLNLSKRLIRKPELDLFR